MSKKFLALLLAAVMSLALAAPAAAFDAEAGAAEGDAFTFELFAADETEPEDGEETEADEDALFAAPSAASLLFELFAEEYKLAIDSEGPFFADSFVLLRWVPADLGSMSGNNSQWNIQARLMDGVSQVSGWTQIASGFSATSAMYNIPASAVPGDYMIELRAYRNATNISAVLSVPVTVSEGTVVRPNLFPQGFFEDLEGWEGAPRAPGDAGSPDMNGVLLPNDNPAVLNANMVALAGTGEIMRHPVFLQGNATYRLTVWGRGGTDSSMSGVTLGPPLGSDRADCWKGTGLLCHDFWCGCDSVRNKLAFTTAGDGGGWVKKTIVFSLVADLEGEIMVRAWPPNWNSSDPGWPGPGSTFYISEISVELLYMAGDVHNVSYGAENSIGGTITGAIGITSFKSGATVADGRLIHLTAAADPGFALDTWIVNGVDTGSSNTKFSVYVTEELDIAARFKAAERVKVSYSVNCSNSGALFAQANRETFASGASVPEGLSLVFKAAPNDGFEVKYWMVNGERIFTTTKLFTVAFLKGDYDITAVFGLTDESGGRESAHNGTNKNRLGINLVHPASSSLTGGLDAVFPADYLDSIDPYGVLRFMDFTHTNSHVAPGTEHWSNRVMPEDNQHGAQGAAWEYVIALANTTNKDIWISLPVRANDDYVTQLALMMKEHLNPGIAVYVEWGNEVWGFSEQVAVNRNMANAANIPGANQTLWDWRPAGESGGSSQGLYGWGNMNLIRHFAQRSAEIGLIFREVFGESDNPISEESRIRPVITWQVMPDFVTPMMEWLNTHSDSKFHNAHEYIYAVGIAPYFSEPSPANCDPAGAAREGFGEDVVAYIHNHMYNSIRSGANNIRTMVAAANRAGLIGGVTSYEGGPHHQGQTNTNLVWRTTAQKDPEMTNIIINYIVDNWYDIGAGLFMYFSHIGPSTQYGYWGNLDNLSEDQFISAPKFAALKIISQLQYDECKLCGEIPCVCDGLFGCRDCEECAPSTDAQFLAKRAASILKNGLLESQLKLSANNNATLTLVIDGREFVLALKVNNRNVSGKIDLPDGSGTLVFDIKGNGSNIKEFKII